MDVQMPVLNGYEATHQIRRMEALANLPIVALTAGAFGGQQDLANQAGMTGFLAKPFDVEAAIALILNLTRHRTRPTAPSQKDSAPLENASVPDVLPGIAYAKGMAIWRDEIAFKKFLRLFVRDYANVVSELRQLDRPAAIGLAHKFKGAAANMALVDVAERADVLEQLLHTDQEPLVALDGLQAAMQVVLETIAQFAPPLLEPEYAEVRLEDASAVMGFLAPLLEAWSSDSTRAVRQAIADLIDLVPPGRLAAIQAALDAYDFKAGLQHTRELMDYVKALLGDA
jgi:CheY-like chemotaxis protein